MKNFTSIALLSLLASCAPAFAGGDLSCPAPTIIKERVEVPAECPYFETTEKVYVTTTTEVPRDAYVIGMYGFAFSNTTGETDYGSIHDRDTDQTLNLGSHSDILTGLVGVDLGGWFDFWEFGVASSDFGERSSSAYTDDLGLNLEGSSLEGFVQGRKDLLQSGPVGVHGLLGGGLRTVTNTVSSSVDDEDDRVSDRAETYTTPTLRAGLGLSLDVTDSVAIVARTLWSYEVNTGDDLGAYDRCWNDAAVGNDTDGLEAGIGIQFTF